MKNKNDAISSKHVFDEIGGENIHHFRLRVSSLPPVSKVLLCFIILHCLFLLLYISFMLSFKTGGALPHLTENEAIWLFGMMLAVTAYAIYFSVDGIITENVYQLASFLSTTIIGTGFGWRFFQKVAADVGIKAMYTKYQLFLTFLRFDLLFQTLSIITVSVYWAYAFLNKIFLFFSMLYFSLIQFWIFSLLSF
mmetsp:Transcript_37738/g.97368  ORF Transcript_37738/g.97368 Transcript_37738/m.97368 type:complete len:194 (-) Transcript_37738:936-1517(-)